jgi:hypothetical protein
LNGEANRARQRQNRAIIAHVINTDGVLGIHRSPPPGLRLPQAKLLRNSNQIARGRIRRFESYHPSHAVVRGEWSGAQIDVGRNASRRLRGLAQDP